MGQKQIKRMRRELRKISAAITGILPQAERELDQDHDAIDEWLEIVLTAKWENPEIPISDLLPSKLGIATTLTIFRPLPAGN